MQPTSASSVAEVIAQLKRDFETQINLTKNISNLSDIHISQLESLFRDRLALLENQTFSTQYESKVSSSNEHSDEEIKLNIGGQIFLILKTTLLKQDKNSMFNSMFSGRYPLQKAEDGSIFIDRDPTHFGTILNYLRDGTAFVPPESVEVKEEILREADFYNLQGLIWIIEGKLLRVKELGPVNTSMKADEDRIRKLFLDNPTHELLKDPYIHLLDVFDEKIQPSFVFPSPSENNATLPLLFSHRRWTGCGRSIASNIGTFESRWKDLCPLLQGLNWNNLVAAGGSVLAALAEYPTEASRSELSPELDGGDVDLFLWGLDENQAREKIKEIFDHVHNKQEHRPIVVVRTSRTLTLVCGAPQRHIQIVLRLYRSPAEVIFGFDLDCCCVLYDGKKVWALPRARRALNYRYNVADPTRQTFRTTSYEYRLWKYSRRLFAVAVPGFRRHQVNKEIFDKEFEKLKGFAKLLFLEEKDWISRNSELKRQQDWFELNDHRNYNPIRKDSDEEDSGSDQDSEHSEDDHIEQENDNDQDDEEIDYDDYFLVSQYRESQKKFMKSLNATHTNGFKDMESLSHADVIGNLVDYNNGVLLPYSYATTTDGIFNRLTYKSNYIIKNTPEGQTIDLFYTFGWDLEQAIDATKFHILHEVKRDFCLHVPKHVEFIGSLAQYIQSLPEVEEDWFAEGLVNV